MVIDYVRKPREVGKNICLFVETEKWTFLPGEVWAQGYFGTARTA